MSAHVQAEPLEHSRTEARNGAHGPRAWNSEDWPASGLAEEQMRGLAARVFLGPGEKAARHVMLGGVDEGTRSWELCTQLGITLARETAGTVLLARGNAGFMPQANPRMSVREFCLRLAPNLWMLADSSPDGGLGTLAYQTESFHHQVRREFDYSIMHLAWSRLLSEAARMAALSDGLILAIGQATRRAAARHIREELGRAGVPLIGAVLTGRTFPVPEGVYRRL